MGETDVIELALLTHGQGSTPCRVFSPFTEEARDVYTRTLTHALADQFGSAWERLTPEEQAAVREDFALLCREEYDVGDPTADSLVEEENITAAVVEYYRNIGGPGGLPLYAACMIRQRERSKT